MPITRSTLESVKNETITMINEGNNKDQAISFIAFKLKQIETPITGKNFFSGSTIRRPGANSNSPAVQMETLKTMYEGQINMIINEPDVQNALAQLQERTEVLTASLSS